MNDSGVWEPQRPESAQHLPKALVDRLIHLGADEQLTELDFTAQLDAEQRQQSQIMRFSQATWETAVKDCGSGQIKQLVRCLTLLEMRLPGWEAGAESPVIKLVKVLKRRGDFPDPALTRWIKQHSDNRFLPYGAL